MSYTKLTPNLVVRDVARSLEFYTSILGFQRGITVPEAAPFVFGSVTAPGIEIYFNEQTSAVAEYPELVGMPIGGTLTLFLQVDDVAALHARVQKAGVKILHPMEDKFYGMREFAIADLDGWMLTLAQKI